MKIQLLLICIRLTAVFLGYVLTEISETRQAPFLPSVLGGSNISLLKKQLKPVFQKDLGSFGKRGDTILGFADRYPSGISQNNGEFHVLPHCR